MNIEVHINNVRGSQIAAKITGTFNIDGHPSSLSHCLWKNWRT